MLKTLALNFGGDRACTDSNRVLRLPGFLNWKYVPAFPVRVEYLSNATWNRDQFRLDVPLSDARFGSHDIVGQQRSHKGTNSENDWAWVSHELAHGKDTVKLTRELSTPSNCQEACQRSSKGSSNTIRSSIGRLSQALSSISCSSWPASQLA